MHFLGCAIYVIFKHVSKILIGQHEKWIENVSTQLETEMIEVWKWTGLSELWSAFMAFRRRHQKSGELSLEMATGQQHHQPLISLTYEQIVYSPIPEADSDCYQSFDNDKGCRCCVEHLSGNEGTDEPVVLIFTKYSKIPQITRQLWRCESSCEASGN